MAHNLDINNGIASFASARTDAWHQLGTTFPTSMTAEEALREAHLAGWNLRKLPLFTRTPEGLEIPASGRFAVVRDNPVIEDQVDFLGDVGNTYRLWQNEELTTLLESLVDESGANFETAGALDGGRKVFVTMKMPGHMKLGGVDPVENYLALVTSHDGSMSHTLMTTPVRIVCQNTLNVAFNRHRHMMRIRHTQASESVLLSQARHALDITFTFLEGFQEEADRMLNTTLTQIEFEKIIDSEFGVDDDAPQATQTRVERKIDKMAQLFADSYTHEGVRETAWAGFNALTEYYDHFSPTRGDEQDESRAVKAVLDSGYKQRALEMFVPSV